MHNSADLVTLFEESPEVFTEEFIIDELIDFFFAASGTTDTLSQTIVGHFATAPTSLAKVRAEFSELCEAKNEQATDKLAYLKSEANSEKLEDMAYLD